MSEYCDDQTTGNSDDEQVNDLVQQALELSKIALDAGYPEASALLTLAASGMRKKVA